MRRHPVSEGKEAVHGFDAFSIQDASCASHGKDIITDGVAVEILERFQRSIGSSESAEHFSRMKAAVELGVSD